mmetsp:Transcript_20496/g.65650  ORF Transcript_20496/g.65650 Transcript_20496/m.65650 type:complete len:334 (-) Transcript_20496:986-1987(-)
MQVEQHHSLGAALGNVLVLALLRAGQSVALVEELLHIVRVRLRVRRPHDADAAARNVPEPDVEAAELGAHRVDDGERALGVLRRVHEGRVQAEGERDLGRLEEVGLEHAAVEAEEGEEHLGRMLRGGLLADEGAQLLVRVRPHARSGASTGKPRTQRRLAVAASASASAITRSRRRRRDWLVQRREVSVEPSHDLVLGDHNVQDHALREGQRQHLLLQLHQVRLQPACATRLATLRCEDGGVDGRVLAMPTRNEMEAKLPRRVRVRHLLGGQQVLAQQRRHGRAGEHKVHRGRGGEFAHAATEGHTLELARHGPQQEGEDEEVVGQDLDVLAG